jgi:hypothetical protein
VILQCRIKKTVVSLNNQANGGYESDSREGRKRHDGMMQVTETLRDRRNFSIVFWNGLNIFVIQQFFSQVLRSLIKGTLEKSKTYFDLKEGFTLFCSDPAIRLKGKLAKFKIKEKI